MNGFIAGLKSNLLLDFNIFNNGEAQEISSENFSVLYAPLDKFGKDKAFYNNGKIIILLDGTLLNKFELFSKFKVNSVNELIIKLYKEDENFFSLFRGSFRGLIYNIENQKLIAYTNQTGEKALYYYYNEEVLILSSNFKCLVETIKQNNNLKLSINENNLNQLLYYGYYLEDNTMYNEIARITAGKKLEYFFKESSLSIRSYHRFSNNIINYSEDEIINELERLFTISIKRIFDKNIEYNYCHQADLSGGIDSRIINFAAQKNGYNPVVNICYCQSGNTDIKIARKIARDLKNALIFQPLDNGDIIYDIDEMQIKQDGQEFCFVSTGTNKAFQQITQNIGISAMGLLGEVLKGEFTNELETRHLGSLNICFNKNISSEIFKEEYPNTEIKTLYNYGFHYILSSSIMRNQVTEIAAPLLDVDFLEFSLSIPAKLRKDNYIYLKWIHKYYPEMEKYTWQKTMKKLDGRISFEYYKYKITDTIVRIINRIIRISGNKYLIIQKGDMNPFVNWERNDKKLCKFMDQYFNENIDREMNQTKKEHITKAFHNFDNLDRYLILNYLSCLKIFSNY